MSREDPSPPALTHRAVLALAVPVMLSNVSTPLLGVVDTAVVGRIPDPMHIGAVAVGALIFTFAFWAFGFLRMATTGLTAQALGAGDPGEIAASLGRSLLIAVAAGFALIALQWPIGTLALALLDASPNVEELARSYFDIRIWAAPATLASYALFGWFVGLGRTGVALVLQLVLNIGNLALDVLFVVGFGWGVDGVAAGTLIAEVVAAGVGLAIAWWYLRRQGWRAPFARLVVADKLKRTLAANADILVRTLCLILVLVWFVANGAAQGDTVLAANAVLLNFVSVTAFFLDGLAFAAEALVGRAVGAGQRPAFVAAVRLTTLWALVVAVALAGALGVVGPTFVDLLTVDAGAREAARMFLPWATLAPLLGVFAFQLDGVFIGATRTAQMRNAALATLAIYLASWWLLRGFGNHGLWAALSVSYVARAGTLLYYYPALVRSIDSSSRRAAEPS